MKRIIYFFITIVILTSCSGSGTNISRDDVLTFMEEYYENVKQNNFTLIASLYSDAFYENTNRESWEELYSRIHSLLGNLISIELESWNTRSVSSTSGSGRHFTLVYKNRYENGYATETINIFVPRGENEIRINGHNFNSDVFAGL